VVVLAGLWAAWACAAAPADEAALWRLWTAHQKAADGEHRTCATECAALAREHPTWKPVGEGLAAWHLLKAGATAEAARLLQGLAAAPGDDPLVDAGREMARRWLTRLDRAAVQAALRTYYQQFISYPETLAELSAVTNLPTPPLTDRWNKPWRYRRIPFRRLARLRDQRYELESAMLPGAASDLTAALRTPYAGTIRLKAVTVTAAGGERQGVEFETAAAPAKRVLLAEGTDYEGVRLVKIGASVLLLSDGDYWLVLARPTGP